MPGAVSQRPSSVVWTGYACFVFFQGLREKLLGSGVSILCPIHSEPSARVGVGDWTSKQLVGFIVVHVPIQAVD